MKKIVLFLHGYGSNGNDLISLKDYISLEKEETELYLLMPRSPVNSIILGISGFH